MTSQAVCLIFLLPFSAAVAMPMLGAWRRSWCRPLALSAVGLMALFAFSACYDVLTQGPVRYALGGWDPPVGIVLVLDGLSGLLAVALSLVSLACLFFGGPALPKDLGSKVVPYHTLVLLMISALAGVTLSGDLFNLFVFLEVSALCAYALVGLSGGRALIAAFRYLILGTIGASFYLLGVGYFYAATGTLNMEDFLNRLPDALHSKAVLTGLTFILLGLAIKAAMVPFHGWLPDAYAHAPDAVVPLLASLVTKVSLYAMTRITFWVLGASTLTYEFPLLFLLSMGGTVGAVVGAFLALTQQDLRRMFAYGGISHVGLIVIGITAGNQTGFSGGVFYLANDAVMQATLFFIAGIIMYRCGARDLNQLGHLGSQMPWTSAALIVTALSMIGIPPTGGFFGKWYMVLGALEAKNYLAVAAILSSTLLTLAYFVRIIERMFGEKPSNASAAQLASEEPVEMRVSMGALAASIILLGLFSDRIVGLILRSAVPPGLG
ncbi:MAG: monovalent cation/H+ antiporter subunit D [Nitrospira sp.]|nr:MAG: monovalent cation/H+ antiporter subunit D [Nitrospira sp.]